MGYDVVAVDVSRVVTLDEIGSVEDIYVYCWRMERMLSAGYPRLLADSLAINEGVDLHIACDLIARGCDARTAYSILS